MGQPHNKLIAQFIESENSYTTFLSFYIHFLNNYISDSKSIENVLSTKTKTQISLSLSLITNIHLHIMARNIMVENFLHYPLISDYTEINQLIDNLKSRLYLNPYTNAPFKQSKSCSHHFNYQFDYSIKAFFNDHPISDNPWQ